MNGEFYQKVKKNIDLTWYNYNFQLLEMKPELKFIYIFVRYCSGVTYRTFFFSQTPAQVANSDVAYELNIDSLN